MKFTKLNNPNLTTSVVTTKYLVDWERKVSKPQLLVKQFLKPYWENCCVLEEMLIPGSKLRADLINLTSMVFLEVSPDSTHLKFNPFMHRSRAGYLGTVKRDNAKKQWAKENNFLYIELNDVDLKNLSKEMFAAKGLVL